jgi:hypothetical protein
MGRQLQVVFFRNVNDRLRADRAFEMDVDLGFGDVVVFRVEVFHKQILLRRSCLKRDFSIIVTLKT